MPKFNEDIITYELWLLYVWIIALNFYLILKRKKSEEFRKGVRFHDNDFNCKGLLSIFHKVKE